MRLSLDAARTLLLAAQGLLDPPAAPAEKEDVLAVIRRMGALQIDTIHVVARSPYLVLWSRLGAYQPRWLDELLAEGALFEYWSHEASFLPIEDYPLYRRLMLEGLARSWDYISRWIDAHHAEVDRVLAQVRANGGVRSADFERTDGQKGTWWNWKVEKMALEMLYTRGDLMIARRQNFQRVYDLRERVLPAWDDSQAPSLEETRRALALKTVHALGVTPARWLADYFRLKKQNSARLLEQLATEGALLAAEVEGWKEPAYIHPEHRALAEAAASGMLRSTVTTLLSPFDPLVWDRARALELFGFEYRIECYTPAPKRRYGYFTLPILHRGALAGRLDPKAHRKEGVFEVKALYLEPGVPLTPELLHELAGALRACAAWHGCPQVLVRRSEPPELAASLERECARGGMASASALRR
ncbi:MAG TPA: crosslink repair DNA glycosylase YcaQ family protein [Roseiflexaceae bacterium]|nr:crosslink repair DNA glycosylase YcaQ family protein [Roseiflexaceae bacterium]